MIIEREYPRAIIQQSENGLENIIKSVYCIVKISDENGNYENLGFDIVLDPPVIDQFVPFENITKELIDSWVLPKDTYKDLENLCIDLYNKKINKSSIEVELSL